MIQGAITSAFSNHVSRKERDETNQTANLERDLSSISKVSSKGGCPHRGTLHRKEQTEPNAITNAFPKHVQEIPWLLRKGHQNTTKGLLRAAYHIKESPLESEASQIEKAKHLWEYRH